MEFPQDAEPKNGPKTFFHIEIKNTSLKSLNFPKPIVIRQLV